jgi:hypothetical protein
LGPLRTLTLVTVPEAPTNPVRVSVRKAAPATPTWYQLQLAAPLFTNW